MRDQKQPQPYHERLLALGKQGDVSREGQDDGVEHHGAEQVAGMPPKTANNKTVAMGLPTPITMGLPDAAPITATPTAAA